VRFTPRPPNPFPEFIATYFARCQAACPRIIAIAGKWRFEDLIPGLSDFDTRFVVESETSPEEWAAISRAVGHVHTALALERPDWVRILEHTPGVNMALDELADDLHYSPQMHAWSWYGTARDDVRQHIQRIANPWTAADELYHLKKFAQYWGPYQRGIDPPVNLGAFENKYALHSRYLHYFAPAVHAAVSIRLRQNVCGKFESLRFAREVFPMPEVIDSVIAAVSCHYEVPESYDESRMAAIESSLGEYLDQAFDVLAPSVSITDVSGVKKVADLRRLLSLLAVNVPAQFIEKTMFMRLMAGRLRFFSQQISAFDSEWLIRNELGRLGTWACHQPLIGFADVRLKRKASFEQAIEILLGRFLSPGEAVAFQEAARLSISPMAVGEERSRARAIAEHFEPVQTALDRLSAELKMWCRSQLMGMRSKECCR
jgi:hypothetical protein